MPKANEPEMSREDAKKEKADHAKAKKDLAKGVKDLKAARKTKDAAKIAAAKEELEEVLVTHTRHLTLSESKAGRDHLKGGRRTRRRSRRGTMRR
jgi:hypothetical protein